MFVVSQEIQRKVLFNIQTEQNNIKSKSFQFTIPIPMQNNISSPQNQLQTNEKPIIQNQQQQQTLPTIPFKKKKIKFCLSINKKQLQAKAERNLSKKNQFNKKKLKRSRKNENYQCGRWKEEEHQRFVDSIIKYGNDWKQVQTCVKTRSSTQARSHAQKFFIKLKNAKLFDFDLDLTKNSIKLLHEVLNQKSEKDYKEIKLKLYQLAFEKKYSYKNQRLNDNQSDSNSSNSYNYSRKNTDTITNQELNAHYILSTFLNNLTYDNLYSNDQRINSAIQDSTISIDYNNNDCNYNDRRIRQSIGSINEYFINSIEDNDIKDLHLGNNNNSNSNNMNNNNKDYALNFSHFFNQKQKDSNDKFIFPSNNNSRKVSQDEDYLFSYSRYNINNN